MSGGGILSPSPATGRAAGSSLALVAFTGQTDLWWLRLLKPGFRHCFVVLRDRGQWVLYDPMAHATALQGLALAPGTDVFRFLLDQGYVVVPAHRCRAPQRPAPIAPFTCVEAVKRILGIHARFVTTPWGLFRFLTINRKKIFDIR